MGRRGPKNSPTKLKLLRGETDKRRLNENEPEPGPAGWEMPPSIADNEHARTCWEYHRPILEEQGLLSENDYQQFVVLCESWNDYQTAGEMIREHGYTAVSPNGSEYPSPWFNIKKTAMDRLHKASAHFGLSPADRASLSVKPKDKGGLASKLAKRKQG